MGDGELSRDELTPDLVEELRAIARRLGCSEGTWTLEVVLQNGEPFQAFRKHGPIKLGELRALAGEGGA